MKVSDDAVKDSCFESVNVGISTSLQLTLCEKLYSVLQSWTPYLIISLDKN